MILNEDLKIIYGPVFLRKFRRDDAEKVWQMSVEEGMKLWIPDQVYQDINEAEEVLDFLMKQYDSSEGPKQVPIVFAVCLEKNGELIGHAGLSPVDEGVEIGYAIEEAQQRNGFATAAISALCQWGKSFYQLERILAIVAAENVASCRALEKAGLAFVEEKERRLHGKLRLVKIYRF